MIEIHLAYDKNRNPIVNPNDAFVIANEDAGGTVRYYGATTHTGSWRIQEVNDLVGTYRFCYGSSGFLSAWDNRASLAYEMYHGF